METKKPDQHFFLHKSSSDGKKKQNKVIYNFLTNLKKG